MYVCDTNDCVSESKSLFLPLPFAIAKEVP